MKTLLWIIFGCDGSQLMTLKNFSKIRLNTSCRGNAGRWVEGCRVKIFPKWILSDFQVLSLSLIKLFFIPQAKNTNSQYQLQYCSNNQSTYCIERIASSVINATWALMLELRVLFFIFRSIGIASDGAVALIFLVLCYGSIQK